MVNTIGVVVYEECDSLSLDLALGRDAEEARGTLETSVQRFVRFDEYTPENPGDASYLALRALAVTNGCDNSSVGGELEALLRWVFNLGRSVEQKRIQAVLGLSAEKEKTA